MNDNVKYAENGRFLRKWEEIAQPCATMLVLPVRRPVLDEDGWYEPEEWGAPMAFNAVAHLFTRHPGAVQPAATEVKSLVVDGLRLGWWAATAWECQKCKTRFFVNRTSDLYHAPCMEDAGA